MVLYGVTKRRVVCFTGAGVYHKNSRGSSTVGLLCNIEWSNKHHFHLSYVMGVSEYSASLRRDATYAVH